MKKVFFLIEHGNQDVLPHAISVLWKHWFSSGLAIWITSGLAKLLLCAQRRECSSFPVVNLIMPFFVMIMVIKTSETRVIINFANQIVCRLVTSTSVFAGCDKCRTLVERYLLIALMNMKDAHSYAFSELFHNRRFGILALAIFLWNSVMDSHPKTWVTMKGGSSCPRPSCTAFFMRHALFSRRAALWILRSHPFYVLDVFRSQPHPR